MANTPHLVDWAVWEGANSLEIDVLFQSSNDQSGATDMWAYHGAAGGCDCSCVRLSEVFGSWGGEGTIAGDNHLCGNSNEGGGGSTCEEKWGLKDFYAHLADKHKWLHMLHLDNKAGDNKKDAKGYEVWFGYQNDHDAYLTGKLSMDWWYHHCHRAGAENGFRGDVTLGVYADENPDRMGFVVGAVHKLQEHDRVWKLWIAWECDQDANNLDMNRFEHGFNLLHGKVSDHRYQRARCDGITTCLHTFGFLAWYWKAKDDIYWRGHGRCSKVITWTVDTKWHMDWYLDALIDAIMTNRPRSGREIRDEKYQHRWYW